VRLTCPHCETLAIIRSSKQLSTTVREASVQCCNVECAHTWVTRIIIDRTIAPSMTPKPGVFIPLSPRSPAAARPAGNQMELGMEHPPPRMAPSG
jgi:hypothetical protein